MWHMNIRQLDDRVVLCGFGLRCRLAECPRTAALYTADLFPSPSSLSIEGKMNRNEKGSSLGEELFPLT